MTDLYHLCSGEGIWKWDNEFGRGLVSVGIIAASFACFTPPSGSSFDSRTPKKCSQIPLSKLASPWARGRILTIQEIQFVLNLCFPSLLHCIIVKIVDPLHRPPTHIRKWLFIQERVEKPCLIWNALDIVLFVEEGVNQLPRKMR